MRRAVIVVDVQNDFCEGGSLAVPGGAAVAAAISDRLAEGDYRLAVATRDHHIDPGDHFAADPDFVRSWPRHCVAGTDGARLHPALRTDHLSAIFDKGDYAAAYSGFEGRHDGELLGEWLAARDIDSVEVIGIATDHCVAATALDAARAGLDTAVRLDLTAGVAADTVAAALDRLRAAGVRLSGETRVG